MSASPEELAPEVVLAPPAPVITTDLIDRVFFEAGDFQAFRRREIATLEAGPAQFQRELYALTAKDPQINEDRFLAGFLASFCMAQRAGFDTDPHCPTTELHRRVRSAHWADTTIGDKQVSYFQEISGFFGDKTTIDYFLSKFSNNDSLLGAMYGLTSLVARF